MKSLLPFAFFTSLVVASGVAAADAPAKRVSFVIDDGPVPQQTEQMLAVFERYHVKVNFSYVGKNVATYGALASAAKSAGHELQNHSYTHPHLRELDDEQIRSELTQTSKLIKETTGSGPAYFWAPFLETDDRVAKIAAEIGLVHFPYAKYHFISTDDWNVKATTAEMIYQRATTDIQDGTVILFHEWREETLAQMPKILEELKRQNCTLLTFSELAKSLPR